MTILTSLRRGSVSLAALAFAAAGLTATAGPASADSGVITSDGPLSSITTTADLNCEVRHVDFAHSAFYGDTACGTLAVVDGVLYGPEDIPAGSNASPRRAFTPLSQSTVTGSGTVRSPYSVTTRVALGSSGIVLSQTDQYVSGSESYDTDITIENAEAAEKPVRLYRAADCYLADSDEGYGAKGAGWTACVDASQQKILQFTGLTGAPRTYEAGYSSVWDVIGNQHAFDDSCLCDRHLDNGVGLSWDLDVPGAGARRVSSRIAFTPNAGVDDRDGDGLSDDWETAGYDYGGVHVPLDEWGADPDRPDVFLQVRWMTRYWTECGWDAFWSGCTHRSRNFAPSSYGLASLRDAFAAQGVNLHIDAGSRSPANTGGRPFPETSGGGAPYRRNFAEQNTDVAKLRALEDTHEDLLQDARNQSFHLLVIGDQPAPDSSSTGMGQTPGSVFFVSGGLFSSSAARTSTIMHELGHNLGLKHGGPEGRPDSDLNCKPNYRSVMNYQYQFRGLGLQYETRTSTNNPAPSIDDIQECINGGARSYPTSAYEVHADWPDLHFTGGGIGGVSAGSLIDPVVHEEAELDDLLEAGLAGEDGDGSVDVVGPTVLFQGVDGQTVAMEVTNLGNTATEYEVALTSGDTVVGTATVVVPAHETRRVEVSAPTISGTSMALTASLRPVGGGATLASKDVVIPVLPLDPDAAAAALAAATTEAADLPDALRESLVDLLEEQADADGGGDDGVTTSAGPEIIGAPRVGDPVFVDRGSWSPSGVRTTVQWLRDGEPVAGATRDRYVPTAADLGHRLSVAVTGALPGQPSSAVTAESASQAVRVGPHPWAAVPPSLSGGARVGEAVTASRTSWDRAGVRTSFVWCRDGRAIAGADDARYVLTAADLGHRIDVKVIGSLPGHLDGVVRSGSLVVGTGAAAVPTRSPEVDGEPTFGETLTLDPGRWTGSPDLEFRWLRDGDPVPGASARSYRLTRADVGKEMSVEVRARRTGFEDGLATTPPLEISKADAELRAVAGAVQYGRPGTVRVTGSRLADGDVVVTSGETSIGRGTISNGRGAVRTGARALLPGKRPVLVTFLGSDVVEGDQQVLTLRVRKALTTITVGRLSAAGARLRIPVCVTGRGVEVTGVVSATSDGRVLASRPLRRGCAGLLIKRPAGSGGDRVRLAFEGNEIAQGSARSVRLPRRSAR